MSRSIGVLWLRQDLRLDDNPALCAAAACDHVLPVWIDEGGHDAENASADHETGAASRVWTHHSLHALGDALATRGTRLLVGCGDALTLLQSLIEAVQAADEGAEVRLFWNRRYDPAAIERDKRIKQALVAYEPRTFNALLINEPWDVLKKDGTPYRVYTPYWRAVAARWDEQAVVSPLDAPTLPDGWQSDAALADAVAAAGLTSDIDALQLLPSRSWHTDMIAHWAVGEHAAAERLAAFLGAPVHGYDESRDLPGVDGTSRLSPHLHHGELSPRRALATLLDGRRIDALGEGETTFAKELVWREFAYTMLYHFPHTLERPLDRRFERFEWNDDGEAALRAWQQGRTGVPIVDAGMRQLYATGWMHNRVRMVVASYLVKNLLIDWRDGEAWFRDTLVDADLASNTLGWQWAAGCGADAAPFFRIFNPVLQGEKFDKDGAYTRHWVPELDALPARWLHKPWEAPAAARAELDYPDPLVDLKLSRQRALDAFAAIKLPAA